MFGMFWELCKEQGATVAELILLLLLCVALGFIYQLLKKIATNHLHHLSEAIEGLQKDFKSFREDFIKIDKRVTILEVKEEDK